MLTAMAMMVMMIIIDENYKKIITKTTTMIMTVTILVGAKFYTQCMLIPTTREAVLANTSTMIKIVANTSVMVVIAELKWIAILLTRNHGSWLEFSRSIKLVRAMDGWSNCLSTPVFVTGAKITTHLLRKCERRCQTDANRQTTRPMATICMWMSNQPITLIFHWRYTRIKLAPPYILVPITMLILRREYLPMIWPPSTHS
mmetsp:Transcript_22783/g.32644  ORF Transcript_22783/g.32644 Transcript_22783/m.32644 type:complete len:201 (-) Transcript_22783:114-716(-)